jgi:hypothetical protein
VYLLSYMPILVLIDKILKYVTIKFSVTSDYVVLLKLRVFLIIIIFINCN